MLRESLNSGTCPRIHSRSLLNLTGNNHIITLCIQKLDFVWTNGKPISWPKLVDIMLIPRLIPIFAKLMYSNLSEDNTIIDGNEALQYKIISQLSIQ